MWIKYFFGMTNVEIIMVPYNYDHNNFNFIDETKKSQEMIMKMFYKIWYTQKICQEYTTIKLS